MKNLRLNFAVLAILAGSALAVSTSANVSAKPLFSNSTYETVHDLSNPPSKTGGALPNSPSSYCALCSVNCAAQFNNTTGAYITGTLVIGTFSN